MFRKMIALLMLTTTCGLFCETKKANHTWLQHGKQQEAVSYIVASSEENTIKVLGLQVFEPPIFTEGDKIVGNKYRVQDFPWWDAFAVVYRFDKLSYEEFLSYLGDNYKKLVSKEKYLKGVKNIDVIKKSKKTINYTFCCSYKGDTFLFIGTTRGHSKGPFPKEFSVTVLKKIDTKWKRYSVEKKDYDRSNLIFMLPFSNLEKLKSLVKSKLWKYKEFENAFKNELKNKNTIK